MRLALIIIFLFTTPCFAQVTKHCIKPVNQKYSFKDFTGQDFKSVPKSEFDNTCIVGSSFYQENKPKSSIFPSGMFGVEFVRCNLDNVVIPINNTIHKTSSNRTIKVQNDLNDWLVNKITLAPIDPLDKQRILDEGGSIDPADLPAKYIREEEISKTEWDRTYGQNKIPDKSWCKVIPTITSTRTAKEQKPDGSIVSEDYYKIECEAYRNRNEKTISVIPIP